MFPLLGGVVVGLVPGASVGESCWDFDCPNVVFLRHGGIFSGSPFLSIPIFSLGHSLSIFLSKEVHFVLADYCMKLLPSLGVVILTTNLSLPRIFFPNFSCSS